MKLTCSGLGCSVEKPVDYCKECSHANWIINKYLTFNPRFGFDSKKEIDFSKAEKWIDKITDIDIGKASFLLN